MCITVLMFLSNMILTINLTEKYYDNNTNMITNRIIIILKQN